MLKKGLLQNKLVQAENLVDLFFTSIENRKHTCVREFYSCAMQMFEQLDITLNESSMFDDNLEIVSDVSDLSNHFTKVG